MPFKRMGVNGNAYNIFLGKPKVKRQLGRPRCNGQDARNINLLKPTGYVMHQQFNIQQLYVLPTPYLCVLCLSENKQRLVPLTA